MTAPRDITKPSEQAPPAKLTKERTGEIAYALLKDKLRREEIKLDPSSLRRDIGNSAERLGISPQELKLFIRYLVHELLDEAFR